jgi:hypothetical protein
MGRASPLIGCTLSSSAETTRDLRIRHRVRFDILHLLDIFNVLDVNDGLDMIDAARNLVEVWNERVDGEGRARVNELGEEILYVRKRGRRNRTLRFLS